MVRLEVLVLMSVLTLSCGKKCTLDAEARELAPEGAVDCGRVSLGGDRTATDECVLKNFQEGKPFHGRYERQGIDSHVALGVVRSSDGRVIFLHYDGDPGGGGGDGRPVVDASVCESPRVHASPASRPAGSAPLECASSMQLGRVCE
jgi:hypothetical protein